MISNATGLSYFTTGKVTMFRTLLVLVLFISIKCGQLSIGENDLSLHLYTPDGQVAQLAYASRAIESSPTRISFSDERTGIIAAFASNGAESELCNGPKPAIEVARDISVAYVPTGYSPDISYLLRKINGIVQSHCLTYGEAPNVDYLAYHISHWITRGMYKEDSEDRLSRPLAAAVTIAAYDKVHNQNRLVQIDNTGYVCDKSLSILGTILPKDRDNLMDILESITGSDGEAIQTCLDKCKACAQILLKDDWLEEKDVGDSEYALDCCLLDATGKIYRTPAPLRSVKDTIAWIESTVREETFHKKQ